MSKGGYFAPSTVRRCSSANPLIGEDHVIVTDPGNEVIVLLDAYLQFKRRESVFVKKPVSCLYVTVVTGFQVLFRFMDYCNVMSLKRLPYR